MIKVSTHCLLVCYLVITISGSQCYFPFSSICDTLVAVLYLLVSGQHMRWTAGTKKLIPWVVHRHKRVPRASEHALVSMP